MFDPRCLNRNRLALGRRCPRFLAWRDTQPPRSEIPGAPVVLDSGRVDFRSAEGRCLLGPGDPLRHYREWPDIPRPGTSATVVVGGGLGHGIRHLLDRTPRAHRVLVVEARPDLADACLGCHDLSPDILSGRLSFFPPDPGLLGRELLRLDGQLYHSRLLVRPDGPSLEFDSRYVVLEDRVKATLDRFRVELSGLRREQDQMVENELANYDRALSDGAIRPLKNAGRGLTAVLLGSGPSLVETGALLLRDPGQALMVTGLQTLPCLHRLGLKPHLCLTVGASPHLAATCAGLDTAWAATIPMIYSTRVAPQVVRAYPGPTIPLWTAGGLASFLSGAADPDLSLGPTLTTTLLRLLAWCGVTRTVLTGMDFSWPGLRTHAPGHVAAHRDVAFDPMRHVRTTNAQGHNVVTTRARLDDLAAVEEDIGRLAMQVVTLGCHGLPVWGTTMLEPGHPMAKELPGCRIADLERFLAALERARTATARPAHQPSWIDWEDNLSGARKRLESLLALSLRPEGSVRDCLEEILFFLRRHPGLCSCLCNEILDLAVLSRSSRSFAARDHSRLTKLLDRIGDKARRIDLTLGLHSGARAA